MALNAQYASTPVISGIVLAATADTSLTNPTTSVGTVMTGAASGTRISKIAVKGAATTASGVVRLFIYNGTTYYLIKELLIPVVTSSNASIAYESILSESTTIDLLPIVLPSASYSLRATTSIAQSFIVTAMGANL